MPSTPDSAKTDPHSRLRWAGQEGGGVGGRGRVEVDFGVDVEEQRLPGAGELHFDALRCEVSQGVGVTEAGGHQVDPLPAQRHVGCGEHRPLQRQHLGDGAPSFGLVGGERARPAGRR
jgi:hypothetical protein